MPRSTAFFLAISLAATLSFALPAQAGGWQEMHQTSDDVRVTVGADGVAVVQHHLRYRVVAGRFRTLELAGIDPHAELSSEIAIEAEKGTDVAARVEAGKTPGTVRILIDEPAKGLARGVYFVDVKYKLDLVATKMLTRDGALWKLAWTAPAAPEGHDGARVVFELPPAPTEPRLAASEGASTTLPTLRRSTEKDELELVRAHVPRGEAVTWAARVDPKAFAAVSAPELRPPAPPPPLPSFARSNLARVLSAIALATIAGALTVLLRAKQRAVRAAAEACHARPRPLIDVPWRLGPFAYGLTGALAFASLLWASPILGALLVAGAMALASHRVPLLVTRVRGPGKWQAVADEQALLPEKKAPLAGDIFDLGATKGRLSLLGLVVGIGLASWGLRSQVPGIAFALPIASAVLVPIFVTGKRSELPATPRDLAASLLRPARDELGRLVDLSHVELATIARFIDRGADRAFDDVRLACTPAARMPGLRAIELALAAASPGARAALPELLVRFDDGSEAGTRLATVARGASILPGRAPEEKVVRFAPEEPTPRAAARALARLLRDLEGRRATDREAGAPKPSRRYRGPERRRLGLEPAASV